MTSLSTRFLGQPRLTKPTFVGAGGAAVSGMDFLADTGNYQRATCILAILASWLDQAVRTSGRNCVGKGIMEVTCLMRRSIDAVLPLVETTRSLDSAEE